MNSDFYFSIGKSHMICQDYAYAGINANGNPVAIVSDGCSASPETDFGSRYLVRSSVICGATVGNPEEDKLFSDVLMRTTIGYASQCGIGLRLSPQCLDATLLYLEVKGDEVIIVVGGDGVVFAKNKKNEDLELWNIEYPSGSPFYPSYLLDNARFEHYRESCSMERITYATNKYSSKDITESQFYTITLQKNEYEFVGVASDGVLTFEESFVDTMKELTAYKNYTGEFVKRRMRKHLRKCEKESSLPSDDVSMAVVYLED